MLQDLRLPQLTTSHAVGAATLAGLAGTVGLWYWAKWLGDVGPAQVLDSLQSGNRDDEILVVGLPKVSEVVSSVSPFCTKLEAWLRFVGLPYTRINGNPANAPKGKLPIIRHGKNTLADSTFIIKYLERTYAEVVPDWSAEQEALSVTIQHFVENYLTCGLAWHRWIHPKGWKGIQQHFLHELLEPFRSVIMQLVVRPKVWKALCAQGLAQHSERDINDLLDEGFAALSVLLGDKRYFLGVQPCVADASVFGLLDSVLFDLETINPDLREIVKQYTNLVAYTERIRNTFFEGELKWEETTCF